MKDICAIASIVISDLEYYIKETVSPCSSLAVMDEDGVLRMYMYDLALEEEIDLLLAALVLLNRPGRRHRSKATTVRPNYVFRHIFYGPSCFKLNCYIVVSCITLSSQSNHHCSNINFSTSL